MPDISGDMMQGAALALAAAGVMAGIRWLAMSKARQLDGLPQQLHQMELRQVEMAGRLGRAEAEIANDKAGRAAVAAVQTDVAVIRATLATIQTEQRDMWSQINKSKGSSPPP